MHWCAYRVVDISTRADFWKIQGENWAVIYQGAESCDIFELRKEPVQNSHSRFFFVNVNILCFQYVTKLLNSIYVSQPFSRVHFHSVEVSTRSEFI